eukprot:1193986-Prorocentrum_minimum.AAC.5
MIWGYTVGPAVSPSVVPGKSPLCKPLEEADAGGAFLHENIEEVRKHLAGGHPQQKLQVAPVLQRLRPTPPHRQLQRNVTRPADIFHQAGRGPWRCRSEELWSASLQGLLCGSPCGLRLCAHRLHS